MIRKLIFLFISIPIAVVLILLSVANRTPITLSLDPFRPESPAYAVTAPFFVYVFVALITGLILGAIVMWISQGRHRKRARLEHSQVEKWKSEAEANKKRADELAAEKASELLGIEPIKEAV